MKCICGYEQKDDFERVSLVEPVTANIEKRIMIHMLHYCPKCGTAKVNFKRMQENEITDKSV